MLGHYWIITVRGIRLSGLRNVGAPLDTERQRARGGGWILRGSTVPYSASWLRATRAAFYTGMGLSQDTQ